MSGKYSFEALWAGEDAVIDVGVGVPARWSEMSYKNMLKELELVRTKARDAVMDGTLRHTSHKRAKRLAETEPNPKRTICSYCKGKEFWPYDDHVDSQCELLQDCQAKKRAIISALAG